MDDYDRTLFSINYNTVSSAGPCAVCGGVADPAVGLALFLRDTFEPVCDRCGQTYAPEMAALLAVYTDLVAKNTGRIDEWPD